MNISDISLKGPSIKDVSPKGEGGGYPQKETLGDGGGTPFGAKETSFFSSLNSEKKFLTNSTRLKTLHYYRVL